MTKERIEAAAARWLELYALYSKEPVAIDRLLPEGRVTLTDIRAEFPDCDLFAYWEEVLPLVKQRRKARR